MFGISFAELVIILVLVLVVMGPEKLPEVARWAGKGMRELRQATNTLRNALEVEDLDASQSRSRPAVDDRSTTASSNPSPTSSSTPPTSNSRTSPPKTSSPSDDAGPPANLDQVDDRDFDKLLEEQYRRNSADVEHIELPNATPAAAVDTVGIPAVDEPSLTSLYDVAIPAHASAEAA